MHLGQNIYTWKRKKPRVLCCMARWIMCIKKRAIFLCRREQSQHYKHEVGCTDFFTLIDVNYRGRMGVGGETEGWCFATHHTMVVCIIQRFVTVSSGLGNKVLLCTVHFALDMKFLPPSEAMLQLTMINVCNKLYKGYNSFYKKF